MKRKKYISTGIISRRLTRELGSEIYDLLLLFENTIGVEAKYFLEEMPKPQKIQNRKEWILQKASTEDDFWLCNDDSDNFIKFKVSDLYNPQLGAVCNLSQQIPLNSTEPEKIVDFFIEGIGWINALGGSSGYPFMTALCQEQRLFRELKPPAPYGLPFLLPPAADTFGIHELPMYIDWLNFWSTEMLQNLDYKHAKHQHLFYRVEQLKNGNVFQLTEQPTDPEIPVHLEKLLAVYQAFPKIGGAHLIKDMDFD